MDGSDLAPLDLAQRYRGAAIQSFLGKTVSLHQSAKLCPSLFLFWTRRRAIQLHRDVRFQPLAQSDLHLVGRLVGESQSDDLRQLDLGITHQKMHQPVYQQASFSRARARRDDDIAIEGGCGSMPV